jgi:hypothetical protein
MFDCYKEPYFESYMAFFNSFYNKEVFPISNSTIKKNNMLFFGIEIPDEMTLF